MTPTEKKQLVRALEPIWSRVRTDISAIKFEDGSRWTDRPIDTAAKEQHVNGGPPRGACPIKEGESVTLLGVLDMDSHKGQTSWEDMVAAATDLRDGLAMWGLNVNAFRSSGGRGIHLIVMWEAPQDAYSVRQALTTAIGMCGYANGAKGIAAKQIEVFPKQDEVGIGEKGNQFILPLAGHSTPLDLDLGIPLDRTAVIGMDWHMSDPVPHLERPGRELQVLPSAVEPMDKVREALFTIVNDGSVGSPDYEEWFTLCCSVHEATGGSEEGKALFAEWSEQNPIFDEKFYEDRVWEYVKPADKRTNAITRGTLYARASKTGWNSATPDGFSDVEEASPQGTVLEQAADGLTDEDDIGRLPPFVRHKNGDILSTIGNLLMACRRPDICGWTIGHDRFRDEIMISTNGGEDWRSFGDADYTRMREYLEKNGFEPIGKEMCRDVIHLVAQEKAFDSAVLWLNSLPKSEAGWMGAYAASGASGQVMVDGPTLDATLPALPANSRIATFMSKYMGCEDTPYTRAVGLYLWSALAGRTLDPGCQADMVPVFIGQQGSGKSSAVMALAPSLDFYVEIAFHEKEDDLARKMRGRLVGEFGELTGMRKKEVDALKAFITRRHENWIPKFKEFGAMFPRRLLFIGTTNNEKFLVDDTGNRRWLPVRVGKTNLAALKRDILLLWAEARDLFKAHGVQWQEAERLARDVHEEHSVDDPWEARIANWLDSSDLEQGSKVRDRSHLTTGMVLAEALRLDISRASKGDEMRAASLLKKMGYIRTRLRVDGRPLSVFVHTLFPPEKQEVGTDAPF